MRELLYTGKAKSVYRTHHGVVMVFQDNLTAFNGKKKAVLPGKGKFNAQISARLFQLLEDQGIKTHYLKMLSETEMLVEELEIIKIEVIVRNIATGSLTRRYPFREGEELRPPVMVLDLKSDEYGDPMINEDIAVSLGLATRKELEEIREKSLEINRILKKYLEEREILLADFKLEFGRRKDGEIILADEISCDTCRFWDKKTRQSLDKDVYRFDKGDTLQAYREAAKRIL